MKKILYLYFGASSPVTKYERITIDKINSKNEDIYVEFWDWTTEFGFCFNPSIDWAYKNQKLLKPFYDRLYLKVKSFDCLFIAQTGGLIPEFLEKLNIKKVFNTADDPESSKKCSFPFVEVVDLVVHAGVNFNKEQKIGEVLKSMGAKETYFMPIGFYDEMFPELYDFDKAFDLRDIPVVFVGAPKIGKLERIFNSYKGDCKVYCRASTAKLSKLYYWVVTGKRILPFNGSLNDLYRNAQIGINVHYSFGPSNVRTYQLCAAGVAQVIDCSEGIGDIYVPGEEVLTYSTQSDAIEHIKQLLVDRDLRYRISKRGYTRTRKEYEREKLLSDLFKYI